MPESRERTVPSERNPHVCSKLKKTSPILSESKMGVVSLHWGCSGGGNCVSSWGQVEVEKSPSPPAPLQSTWQVTACQVNLWSQLVGWPPYRHKHNCPKNYETLRGVPGGGKVTVTAKKWAKSITFSVFPPIHVGKPNVQLLCDVLHNEKLSTELDCSVGCHLDRNLQTQPTSNSAKYSWKRQCFGKHTCNFEDIC